MWVHMHSWIQCCHLPLLTHLSACIFTLLTHLLSHLAHILLPSLPVHSPLSLPLHPCLPLLHPPPPCPFTWPSHLAILTPNSTPHHSCLLTLLTNSSPTTMPTQCPPLLGGMGKGIVGKHGMGMGMSMWGSVCIQSCMHECIWSSRAGVSAGIRIAADICSDV